MSTTDSSTTTPLYLSCHCQKHIYTIDAKIEDLAKEASVCNCSNCMKRRALWSTVEPGAVKVVKGGPEGLDGGGEAGKWFADDYRLGSRKASHQVCLDCGTYLACDLTGMGYNMISINLRAIRENNGDFPVNLFTLEPKKLIPGHSWGKQYHPTQLSDLPGAEAYLAERSKELNKPNLKTYLGSCHCKAVQYAWVSEPIEDKRVWDCSCSICFGNGLLWVNPGLQNVFFHPHLPNKPYFPSEEVIKPYHFGKGMNGHYICKKCGVQLFEYAKRPIKDPRPTEGLTTEQLEARPPWVQDNGYNGSLGMNLCTLNDAGKFLRAIFYLKEEVLEGKEGLPEQIKEKDMKVWERDEEYKYEEPVYKLDI